MDLTITVRGCDQCKRNDRPATRYTLAVENGEPVTRDLCAEDAAPLEAVFGPWRPRRSRARRTPSRSSSSRS